MKKRLYAVLFATGFLSLVAQLVFIREFLSVFFGSELVFGLILGNWLLLTALGSFFGRYSERFRNPVGVLIVILVVLAVSFPALVYLARSAGSYLSLTGELVSVQKIMLSTFAVLALFCVLNGFQFILCAGILSRESDGSDEVTKAYLLESAGSLTGGIIFTYAFAYLLNAFQISYLVSAAYFICALELIEQKSRRNFIALSVFALAFIVLASQLNLQESTNRVQYPGQQILVQKNSLYGNIVVTRTDGQINFFENSVPLFSTENTIANEESVHYAMIQHDTRNVLLISGGVSGVLNQILKYNPDSIDYVELDPQLILVSRSFSLNNSLDSPKVMVHYEDGRTFVKKSCRKYDAILVNAPDPTNAQLNRFYTLEFFEEAKRTLTEGGVVSISLTSSENYISPELGELNSALYWTLRKVFRNVIVVPGYRNYFIASDGELSYDIAGLISQRGIQTDYVNENYLKSSLTAERINFLLDSMRDDGELNTDFKPIAYYMQVSYWSRQFGFDYKILVLAVALLLLVAIVKLKPTQLSVFTIGFMGAAVEVALLIAYQIVYGSAYQKVGLILAAFMLGLTLGAYYVRKIDLRLSNVVLASIVIPLAVSLAIILVQNQFAYLLFAVASGLIVGMAFPLAFKAGGDAGLLYSLDLAGAFTGSVLAGAFLIPTVGLVNTCLIAGGLNALSWIRLRVK